MTEATALPSVLVGQQIKTIPIKDIKIVHRQRTLDPSTKEFKEWAEYIVKLAASIKRAGLIHPVTLEDGTNQLIAGFNRIQAFLHLGLTEIPFVYRSELTEIDREVLELEENVQRLGLPWADQAKAIAKIDELQRRIAGDKGESWTTAKTAEAAGVSVGTVSQAKKIVEAAKVNPKIFDASGLVAALNALKVGEQVERRKADIARREAGLVRTYPAEILVGDASELIKRQADESFDAVITNFPFGVELTLGKEQKQVYHDEEDYIIKLVMEVTKDCYRVLKPNSWMVGFFDIRKVTYSNKMKEFYDASMILAGHAHQKGILDSTSLLNFMTLGVEAMGLTFWMEAAGFDYVQYLPAIWVKPNKTQGTLGDPNKGLIMSYEAFVLAGKGTPVLMKKGRQNIFVYDTPLGLDRDIDVQMPISICEELVAMTCLGGSRILDPFAGSGAVGQGALNRQCSFLGFELDPKRAEMGNLRLKEHIHAKDGVMDPEKPENKEWQAQYNEWQAKRDAMREAGLL